MPRVNLSDLNNYGGGGKYKKTNYLSLPNDGDSAQVHFLLDSEDDLNECIYVTHNVKLKSAPKLKYGVRVNCLREYSDPVDECPFCAAGMTTGISCVIPVYNVDTEQVEFWTRGKKEAGRLFRKMAKLKNFSSHLFEITRIGESGDQATDYEYDDLGTEDFDEVDVPEILGNVVLDKSAEDMEYWLDEKDFPPEDSDDDDDDEEEPVRRRSSNKSHTSTSSRRRRPAKEEDEEEPPFDEDEEEEAPKRKSTGGRKTRRRSNEDEF